MEYLLKIVEGPMKGAEIALVEGVATSFGSGDDCDIVVHDATVPPKACEFEVDATGVRIGTDGATEPLPPFEVRSFGTTSLAVGPVDGAWQELIRPAPPHRDTDGRGGVPSPPAPPHREADGRGGVPPPPAALPGADTAGGGRGATALPGVCALLALAMIAALAWFFWPQIAAHFSQDEKTVDAAPKLTLADIATAHRLTLTQGPRPTIAGNLARRTERLAIRALALAADSTVRFDLTDDETLRAASSELVFACSDGALKVEAASNRVVTLSGYAPSRAALETAIRALDADVKGIARVDASRVKVGGTAPAAVAKTPFVREEPPGEHPVVAIPAHTPNPPVKKVEKARDYPIAGILTVPYRCVVMRNGVRLVEGAQIGKAVLVRIEAEKLTLNDGGAEIEWRP